MNLDYYVFAAYVFLLVCAGIWLLGRVLKKSKKGNKEHTSYEKEQKLFTLYQNVEDMLNSFEEYVEEAKGEADKNLVKMQEMLHETKSLAAELKAMQSSPSVGTKEPAIPETSQKASATKDTVHQIEQTESIHIVKPAPVPQSVPLRQQAERQKSKTGNKVAELHARGLAQHEIARQLGVSVREVTLALKITNMEEVK